MRWLAPVACVLVFSCAASTVQAEDPVSFTKQIAPLFVKSCQACHGPQNPKGGYQLFTFERLMQPGESSLAPVKAGSIDDSYLVDLLTETDADVRMPKDGDPLPPEQIALIRRWVAEGAKFDGPDAKASLSSIIPKLAHPEPPEVYRVPMPVTAVAFRPDGQELAVGGYHEITIWNPQDGTVLRRIKNVAERTYGLTYSPDGSLLAAASGTPGEAGEVRLYNPNDGSLVKDLCSMSDVAFGVAFTSDGKRLAACGADRSVRVFDVASGKEELTIEDHADWVLAVAWSHDNRYLATASRDKTAKIFDALTGQSQITYPNHSAPVYGVAWSQDDKQVLTSGNDRRVQIWNPADGKKGVEVGGYGSDVFQVAVFGNQMFTASGDKSARLHDLSKSNQLSKTFAGHTDFIYTLSYNPATKLLATGAYDGEVRVWNTEDGKERLRFKAAPGLSNPVLGK